MAMTPRVTVQTAALLGTVLAGLSLAGCKVMIGLDKFSDVRTEQVTLSDVRLAGDSGSITIERSSNLDGIEIRRTVEYTGHKPDKRYDTVDGTKLVLDTNCGHNCSISYIVRLGSEVDVAGTSDSGRVVVHGVAKVAVTADSGSVEVRDASGDVNVRTDSGRVTATNVKGAVNVQTDSGSVTGNGLGGNSTNVHTESGAVDVTTTAVQNVKVQTDSGSVRVKVPSGTAYLVKHSTDSGHVQIGVPTDPAGRYTLDLHTESGAITVGTT
jgi:Putative adhesin